MKRLLIVDGNPENLRVLSALLQANDCDVDATRQATDALARARQSPPDIIIADLLTLILDGYAPLRNWKADVQLNKIPFVVYADTSTEPTDQHIALGLGADAILLKSADPKLIMARLDEVSARYQCQQAERALHGADVATWEWDIPTGRASGNELWATMRTPWPDATEPTGRAQEVGMHPDDLPVFKAALESHLRGGSDLFENEHRIRSQSGQWRWVLDRGRVVERDSSGQPLRMAGIEIDISKFKEADAARLTIECQRRQSQKMDAIGVLAGGLAHGFNNQLAAIIGYAELAKLDLGELHPAAESIKEILMAVERSKELMQSIVNVSRPQKLNRKPLDFQRVLGESIERLRSTLPVGVELIFHEASEVPLVRADAKQLQHLLCNLVTNAWSAMEGGPGRIEIRLAACQVDEAMCHSHPILKPGSHVRLTVSDTGKGMNAATIERIFEPFFTTKPAGTGIGMGLAIAYGIGRSHQGAITVESQPGLGSTFHVYFPENAEDAAPAPVKPEFDETIRGHGEHILFLDDDEALVYLAMRFLESLGYRFTGHTVAAYAVNCFRANPRDFDLVITDLNMPGMSGIDVAKKLIQIQPEALIVLASGELKESEIEKANTLGIETILKPNSLEGLGMVVRRLLSARSVVRPEPA